MPFCFKLKVSFRTCKNPGLLFHERISAVAKSTYCQLWLMCQVQWHWEPGWVPGKKFWTPHHDSFYPWGEAQIQSGSNPKKACRSVIIWRKNILDLDNQFNSIEYSVGKLSPIEKTVLLCKLSLHQMICEILPSSFPQPLQRTSKRSWFYFKMFCVHF